MKKLFFSLLNLLFPPTERVQHLESLSPAQFLEQAHRVIDTPPHGIESLFHYKDPLVQKALWELKYRGNKTVAKLFADILYEAIVDKMSDDALFYNFTEPIIIPLPLSKERLKERGWNQSEMIVKEMLKINKNNSQFEYIKNLLIKTRHTAPQTSLSKKDRLKNLKGCFAVPNPEFIKYKNIILIDDVTTTGSTILEAIKTLEKAGAKRVIAFTIAH